jgi:XTP/dITP diphosphohydrolase
MHALADDSGLCVDALGGAPGVRSARWSEEEPGPEPASPVCELPGAAAGELGPVAGRAARDERNNDKLLHLLDGVPDAGRGAAYRAVLAVAAPDGRIVLTAEGACRGRIGRERRGTNGFGYDPLFLADAGGGRTMAELSAEEKDALSHRGEAFRRLRAALAALAVPP